MNTFNHEHYDFRMRHPRKHNIFKSIAFGLVIAGAGVSLLLSNTGLISASTSDIIFSWQMLIIAIGFISLFGRGWWFGLLIMLTGAFFLSDKINPEFLNFPSENFRFRDVFWPLILILVGTGLIISAINHNWWKRRWFVGNAQLDYLEDISVFGGGERTIQSEAFRGGKIVCVFGGSKINLMQAKLAEGRNELEVVTVFGGAEILVPSDWNIKTEVANILGGFVDKRATSAIDTSKTLIIKGVAVFGGGEIKN